MTRDLLKRSTVRLGQRTRLAIHAVGLGVWASGGIWLLLHFFFMKQGEFGVQVNSLEPWSLKLHGLLAFASIWLLGLLWGVHITAAWPLKRGRWSGGTLTATLVLLIVSGYLLYYVGEDTIRSYVSAVHWVIGLTLPGLYLWHRVRRRRRMKVQTKTATPLSPVIRR